MPCSSHLLLDHHYQHHWRRVQIKTVSTAQLSPVSCYFITVSQFCKSWGHVRYFCCRKWHWMKAASLHTAPQTGRASALISAPTWIHVTPCCIAEIYRRCRTICMAGRVSKVVEAAAYSESLLNSYQTTRRQVPEDMSPPQYQCARKLCFLMIFTGRHVMLFPMMNVCTFRITCAVSSSSSCTVHLRLCPTVR